MLARATMEVNLCLIHVAAQEVDPPHFANYSGNPSAKLCLSIVFLVVVHEFPGQISVGSIFILNLKFATWQHEKPRGHQPDQPKREHLIPISYPTHIKATNFSAQPTPTSYFLIRRNTHSWETLINHNNNGSLTTSSCNSHATSQGWCSR